VEQKHTPVGNYGAPIAVAARSTEAAPKEAKPEEEQRPQEEPTLRPLRDFGTPTAAPEIVQAPRRRMKM